MTEATKRHFLNRDGIADDEFAQIVETTELWFVPSPIGGAAESQRKILLGEIGKAMQLLGSLAALVSRQPQADKTFDAIDAELLSTLFRCGDRLRTYRNSRGCDGSA